MITDKHTWHKADWITALVAALISFAVYAWTAAPNVTLLDSGEFIVAAQHFGVPHPTGYPVWTFLTWLFLLLPLGNAAWEVAIFSGVCAAAAVGLCAALLSNIQTWVFGDLLQGRLRRIPQLVALSFALMLAFSESMWSQAVIAEVYALHALLIGLFLVACYSWVRKPGKDSLMLLAFFLLTLSFSNHQLTMVLALLPYLLILLLRRRRFLDWFFAGMLTILLGYLGFAILSKEPEVLKTSIRLFYCVAVAFGVFVWLRRFRIQWKLVAFLPVVVAAGLLPHIYMPLASATNPPMNWGYARELDGFFFSINRSQYPGALTDVTVRSLGKLMGVNKPDEEKPKEKKPAEPGRLQMAQLWVGFFWQQMAKAFTPIGIIGYFASIIFIFRLPLPKRVWIYFLHIAFLLAAFLQPITANTKIDNADWWTQMPYHTYTNLILAVLAGLGVGLILEKLARRRAAAFWIAPALLVLPIFPLLSSEATSSQRDHWFGWMYGHDMLKDLPRGSIMIGGTDPGRFVPTYMIFGESGQSPRNKRDPNFDRRDLYIITQNALGEPNYMKYLRDHYTTARPKPANAFERWLGREHTYPEEPIILPTQEEVKAAIQKEIKENEEQANEQAETLIFSTTLKWIWEKNRDKHDFFIEESFPMLWTYDYAIPHGLIYKLNKTKVEKLTPEMVEEDFRFWKEYKTRLLNDPAYKKDFDAQRSFSKLRMTMGNIYKYRKMPEEAERAYREAVELWPVNLEAMVPILTAVWERGDFDGGLALFDQAIKDDPNNLQMWRLYAMAEQRKKMDGEIQQLQTKLAAQPKSRETLQQLVTLYANIGDTNKVQPLLDRALKDFSNDSDMLRYIISYHEEMGDLGGTLEPSKRLVEIEKSNVQNHLLLARAYYAQQKKKEFYEAAEEAVKIGGRNVQETLLYEPLFAPWREEPEFKKLTTPQPLISQ